MFALSAPVDSDPAVAFVPLHAPEALQVDALAADQLRVAVPPLCTVPGLAAKVSVGKGAGGALTLTEADRVAVPPAPVHDSENVLVAVSGPVDWDPESGFCPDHAPDAAHEVALLDDHVKVAAAPLATLVGSALKDIVGGGGGGGAPWTETVTVRDAVPPAPVQASEKELLAESGPVDSEPAVNFVPDHAPEATHESASVEDHVSVDVAPLGTVPGLAVIDTDGAVGGAGAGSTEIVTDLVSAPPRLVHVKEKFCADVTGPTDSEPDGGLLPDQAPDATHDFARSEFHRSTDTPPLATVDGSATSATIGRGSSKTHATRPAAENPAKITPNHRLIGRITPPRRFVPPRIPRSCTASIERAAIWHSLSISVPMTD